MRVHWLVLLGCVAGVGLVPWQLPAAESSSPDARGARGPLYAPHHPFDTDRVRRAPRTSAATETRSGLSTAPANPAEGPAPSEPPVSPTTAPPQTPPAASSTLAPTPLPPVESPLTAEQQARLAELLERYKADQISPEEYHRERARILRQR